jgi:hypothetical protein
VLNVVANVVRSDEKIEHVIDIDALLETRMFSARFGEHVLRANEFEQRHWPALEL